LYRAEIICEFFFGIEHVSEKNALGKLAIARVKS